MQKKFILFTLVGFFIALFAPVAYVSADSVFVGVTIDSAMRDETRPFCLPNGTQISIIGDVSPNSKSTETTACAGQTMWSNLVTLTSGSNYNVKLDVPNCYGPVFFNSPEYPFNYPISSGDDPDPASFYASIPSGGAIIDTRPEVKAQNNGNPQCWIQGDYAENCNQACATAGLSAQGSCTQADPNCQMLGYFLSGKFNNNYSGSCIGELTYPRYSTTGGYYNGRNTGTNYCNTNPGTSIYRLCPCEYQTNTFSFPFTPAF